MNTFRIEQTSRKNIVNEWKRLCDCNSMTTPFQEWELHDIIASHYFFFFLASREWPCYYKIFKDERVIMIAPLAKRYTLKGCYYTSFGATPTIAFQDFIYSDDITEQDMEKCLNLLKEKCGKIKLYNVPKHSMLYKVLALKFQPLRENVNITVPQYGSFEEYYSRLDKHARQNMRTAYNRMKTDGVTWEFEVAKGTNMSKEVVKEVMDMYLMRRKSRYRSTSILHEWFLRHYHFNTIALSELKNSYYTILRIEGKIAAFLAGYTNRTEKYILIPRLAINGDFQRYSPGVVLISETMKVLKSQLHVDELDLSKGNDKYKLTMGGGNLSYL